MKRGFIRFALVACTLLNVAYAGIDSTTSPDIFDLPITTLSGDTFTTHDNPGTRPWSKYRQAISTAEH